MPVFEQTAQRVQSLAGFQMRRRLRPEFLGLFYHAIGSLQPYPAAHSGNRVDQESYLAHLLGNGRQTSPCSTGFRRIR